MEKVKTRPAPKTQADGLKKIIPNAVWRKKVKITNKTSRPLVTEAIHVARLIKAGEWSEVVKRAEALEILAQKYL